MACDIAENGKEVLARMNEKHYDLLLLDMHMPVMSGLEVLQYFSENDIANDTYVVALTAYAMKGDEDKFLTSGCDDYLSKPVSKEDLYNVIDKLTEKE